MGPTIALRMRDHVLRLAAEGNVQVTWTRTGWRKAMAFIEPHPHIYVPEIRRPRDYLFALHELGHVLSPDAVDLWERGDRYSVILCEGAAWAWASAKADPRLLRHLRKKDWDTVAYAYRTYLDPRNEYVPEHAPPPPKDLAGRT